MSRKISFFPIILEKVKEGIVVLFSNIKAMLSQVVTTISSAYMEKCIGKAFAALGIAF